jgi:hypothetical protein
VSLPKIETMISQLNVQFDANAVKMINEACKCDPIDGVSTTGDDLITDEGKSKYQKMV